MKRKKKHNHKFKIFYKNYKGEDIQKFKRNETLYTKYVAFFLIS